MRAEYVVEAKAPNGRSAVGVGIASIHERQFSNPEHDIPATAHTRAKNRAFADLFGLGEVSAEEISDGPGRQVVPVGSRWGNTRRRSVRTTIRSADGAPPRHRRQADNAAAAGNPRRRRNGRTPRRIGSDTGPRRVPRLAAGEELPVATNVRRNAGGHDSRSRPDHGGSRSRIRHLRRLTRGPGMSGMWDTPVVRSTDPRPRRTRRRADRRPYGMGGGGRCRATARGATARRRPVVNWRHTSPWSTTIPDYHSHRGRWSCSPLANHCRRRRRRRGRPSKPFARPNRRDVRRTVQRSLDRGGSTPGRSNGRSGAGAVHTSLYRITLPGVDNLSKRRHVCRPLTGRKRRHGCRP